MVLTVVVSCLLADIAHAYAWMIRHGFADCSSCHIEPMGGSTLTGMGRVAGQTLMASALGGGSPSDAALFAFGVREPEGLRLGGSFRGMSIYDVDKKSVSAFPMQMDHHGAVMVDGWILAYSIGASRASKRYEHSSKAKVFGKIEDEGLIGVSRYHWLGYRLTDHLMVRAGRINLPFGIRTPDHTLWVRSETRTDQESDQQHGASLTYASGRFRGELMASIGNLQLGDAGYWEQGYSGFFEYSIAARLAVGVSSLLLSPRRELAPIPGEMIERNEPRQRLIRQAHGVTARYSPFRELVLLGEMDLLDESRSGIGYVGVGTADYEPLRGLHLAITGEMLDRGAREHDLDREGLGRGERRLGLWGTLNWFVFPHIELRVDWVMRQRRAPTLLSQLHIYL